MEIAESELQVFSALQKYGSNARENYLTESFVFLIRLLLQREREVGIGILNLLVGTPHWFTSEDFINVQTQVSLYDKDAVTPLVARLDIQVEQGERLLYIEVKHDSPLGQNQIEIDVTHLLSTKKAQTQMVLLSRSKSDALGMSLPLDRFHHVCWYEIYNYMALQSTSEPVCDYFIKSFLRFLEEKAMRLNQITASYLDGMQGLVDLTQMLEVAVAQAVPTLKTRRTAGWSHRGVLLAPYWCGFYYDKPFLIVFEENFTNKPNYHKRIDLTGRRIFGTG